MKKVGTDFHPLRVQGRKLAAELLARAQEAVQGRGDGSVTYSAIQKRWALGSHHSVSNLFLPGSGHAIAFGDLLALPRELAREVLMRAFASFDETDGPATRDTLDAIGIDLGEAIKAYKKDLSDGREDDHATHANNLMRIATLAVRGYLAAQRKASR